MNQFYNHERIFYNTSQQSQIEKNKYSIRENLQGQYKLGQHIPHLVENQFRTLYGDPDFSRKYQDTNIRPPIEADTEFWNIHQIPYTLNQTKNQLIDICGTYYVNKDLRVMPNRM